MTRFTTPQQELEALKEDLQELETLRKDLRTQLEGDLLPNIAMAQHMVGHYQGFHPPTWAGATAVKDWKNQQLLHVCIEAGELADAYRKTGEVSLEEAADVFIVLADLICLDHDPWEWLEAIKQKMWKNLERSERYGLVKGERYAKEDVHS
jgi:hypothetical protein